MQSGAGAEDAWAVNTRCDWTTSANGVKSGNRATSPIGRPGRSRVRLAGSRARSDIMSPSSTITETGSLWRRTGGCGGLRRSGRVETLLQRLLVLATGRLDLGLLRALGMASLSLRTVVLGNYGRMGVDTWRSLFGSLGQLGRDSDLRGMVPARLLQSPGIRPVQLPPM